MSNAFNNASTDTGLSQHKNHDIVLAPSLPVVLKIGYIHYENA
jgi:hypothetical protein